MNDRFLLIQSKIEAVLAHLNTIDNSGARKTFLLEFRILLDQADKLHLSPEDHELLRSYWRQYKSDQTSIP